MFLCICSSNYDLESVTADDQTVAVVWNGEVKFHQIFSQLLGAGKDDTVPFTFIFSHDNQYEICVYLFLKLFVKVRLGNVREIEEESQGNVILQVDCYDFDLPLTVNGVRWPTASPSPFPTPPSTSSSLSAGSRKHVVKPLSVNMATPQSQRIRATGGIINVELWVCLKLKKKYWHCSCTEHISHMGTSSCG